MARRILARADNPEAEASELDWINSRTRLLGEGFGFAAHKIEEMLVEGTMVVVREEE